MGFGNREGQLWKSDKLIASQGAQSITEDLRRADRGKGEFTPVSLHPCSSGDIHLIASMGSGGVQAFGLELHYTASFPGSPAL